MSTRNVKIDTSVRETRLPPTLLGGAIDKAKGVAARLLGDEVVSIELIGGGRNSRVYRLRDAGGRGYALKAYFCQPSHGRDRQRAEFASLEFLWRSGVRDVPQPLAADWQARYALYTYAEGRQVPPAEISAADIDAAVTFLGRLKELAQAPGADDLPAAAEACFSGDQLAENLEARLDRLRQCAQNEAADGVLREFLDRELLPARDRLVSWSRRRWPFDRVLGRPRQTLSPSDFGFHNGVRHESGAWVFLDFEYFGWDDPVKMIADFLLHPAMDLTVALGRQAAGGLLARFSDDADLAGRLVAFYPLFGLKWCVILLNEFLPEHFLRRQFAACGGGERQAVLQAQLAKARTMLQRIAREHEHFPYLT